MWPGFGKARGVNKWQKILTVIFLVMFTAITLFVPWIDENGARYGYNFLLSPPAAWGTHPDWSQIVPLWLGLGVVYIGIRALLASPRK
jgi:SNF family Na+-dependent transporter